MGEIVSELQNRLVLHLRKGPEHSKTNDIKIT